VGLGILGGYVWDYGAEGLLWAGWIAHSGGREAPGHSGANARYESLRGGPDATPALGISERKLPPGSILQNKEPFRQTIWFWALSLGCAALLGWAGYQWRVRQIAARLDLQFKARLRERERIAGELHDSFLQGFQD